MSLIRCQDCGKEYSARAYACPNCGGPNEYKLAGEENLRRMQRNEFEKDKLQKEVTTRAIILGVCFLYFCFKTLFGDHLNGLLHDIAGYLVLTTLIISSVEGYRRGGFFVLIWYFIKCFFMLIVYKALISGIGIFWFSGLDGATTVITIITFGLYNAWYVLKPVKSLSKYKY